MDYIFNPPVQITLAKGDFLDEKSVERSIKANYAEILKLGQEDFETLEEIEYVQTDISHPVQLEVCRHKCLHVATIVAHNLTYHYILFWYRGNLVMGIDARKWENLSPALGKVLKDTKSQFTCTVIQARAGVAL